MAQKKEVFRYGPTDNSGKNTLFTTRDGNLIFYGISECNLKIGDKYNKELGKKIAIGRAIEAKRLFEEEVPVNFNDGDAKANRMGVIAEHNIKELLYYFDNLAYTPGKTAK